MKCSERDMQQEIRVYGRGLKQAARDDFW